MVHRILDLMQTAGNMTTYLTVPSNMLNFFNSWASISL